MRAPSTWAGTHSSMELHSAHFACLPLGERLELRIPPYRRRELPKLLSARAPQDAEEERKVRKLAASRHAPGDRIFRARIISLSWQGLRMPPGSPRSSAAILSSESVHDPEEPKPSSPRPSIPASRDSTSAKATSSARTRTSWATLIPLSTRKISSKSWLIRGTMISPR
jgi:hypothetical protein